MDVKTFTMFADALPAYAEIEYTWDGHRTTRLMARDLPRPGRRWTSLTTGTELFGLAEALADRDDVTITELVLPTHGIPLRD
jgi:hypothetical protein